MSESIIDPRTGRSAEVDALGRLSVFAVTEPEDKNLNTKGNTFSVSFDVTPAGANDYFFYLKNDGTRDLFVTDIRISSTVVTRVDYDVVTGTPTSTSAATVSETNRNLGSSNTLEATILADTDLTGLTDEGLIFFEQISATNTRFKLNTTSNIIIPQGSAIAFKRVAATGAISCVVSIVVDDLNGE